MVSILGFIGILVLVFIYFLPTLNAYYQKKTNKDAILLLNLLLGWTIIGWIVALIWSEMKDEKRTSKK